MLLEAADCPYKVIGASCGAPATTVYSDNFETATGWTASGAATTGRWERGVPQATNSSGPKQLSATTSGTNDLVTGRTAGAAAGDNDIDGGTTTITSPSITLAAAGSYQLTLSYYLAHGSNATADDFFRVRLTGGVTATLLNVPGAAVDRDAAWTTTTLNFTTTAANQTIQIAIDAADAGTASLVEAAVDDVRVTKP